MSGDGRAPRRCVVGGPGRRASVRILVLVVAFAALPLLRAPRAEAYVRYKTSTGKGFFWPQTWVPVSIFPASMADVNGNMEMTPAQIVHATSAAAAAWSHGDNACTFLQINVTESAAPSPNARLDYTNAVVFRVASWCAANGDCSAYAPEALAITSVFVSKADGRIIDGDIEVNDKGFAWTDLDSDPAGNARKQDLQNALTHEMGHLIGLDHSCFSPGTAGPVPLDDKGQPIPSCDNAPPEVAATTMFASAIPGDTAKRTLAPDDIQGVCDIYPVAADPMVYPVKDEPPPKPGCAVASPGRGGVLGLAVLAALALARWRRRTS